ncbi:MAG: oxidoreductase [Planctomycetes bacterium]|nr:oxidoreductase [Planctomycetota bacterium]
MKIFIAGDRYFRPDIVEQGLAGIIADPGIAYEGVLLPYPVDHLPLADDTVIPSGMAWDTNADANYGAEGVREYYGDTRALAGRITDAEILVIHGAALPAAVLQEAPALRLIACLRGGPVNIDVRYARERGIRFTNSPGKNAQGVAEFTVGLILSHLRHIPEGVFGIRGGKYIQRFGDYDQTGGELAGKTCGLIGCGAIGRRLAAILQGFGCTVVAYDPNLDPAAMATLGIQPATMAELLAVSDIVSVHARGGDTLLGAREFARMRPGSLFVNTARGKLVDHQALLDGLRRGRPGGAALDVIGGEPFAFYREMAKLPTVTLTPHMAGVSRETVGRGIAMIGEEIRRFLAGQPLRYETGTTV